MKKTLLFAMLAFSMNAFAQTPDWLWAKAINGNTSDASVAKTAIAIDKPGNIYTTGYFFGTLDFDPGVGTYNLTSVSADGSGFILKTDAAGNFIWAKRMGGTPPGEGSTSITIDTHGNVYTIGYFTGTVDFDPGTGVFYLTSRSPADAFISKLDKDGNFVWAKSMFGLNSNSYSVPYSIALDASGNVYTTGAFAGIVDFNPGTETVNITASGTLSGGDMFISKLDSLGNFVWAKDFASSVVTLSTSISIDVSGNVYTTGTFYGTVDFDPGTGVYNLTSNQSAFISKLDASGNFVWVKQIGGLSEVPIEASMALDGSGNIYTTGFFSSTVDFDPGSEIFNLTGSYDIFVSKYTNAGNFVWAKAMVSASPVGGVKYGTSIALDSFGNVFTTGKYGGTVDFDPGAGVFNLTTSIAYGVAYISKLDNSGNFIWAHSIAGATGGTQYSSVDCSSIAIDAANNALVTGNFSTPSVSFGAITLTKTAGDNGGFIARFGDKTTGIEKVVKRDDTFSVFPNPTNGKFTINSNRTINSVEIYNLPGARIYSDIKPVQQTSCEIDLSGHPKGIYLVKIKNGAVYSTRKIVLQ